MNPNRSSPQDPKLGQLGWSWLSLSKVGVRIWLNSSQQVKVHVKYFFKIKVLGSVKIVFVFCSKLYFIPSIIVHKSLAKLLKLPQNTTGKWHKQGITQSSTKLITVFFVAMPILASSDTKKKIVLLLHAK